MDRLRIGYLGYGSYLPSLVLTNEDLERIVDTSDEWIQQRTGIQTRRILSRQETLLEMAVEASRRAINDAGLHPSDIGDIRVGVNTWNRFPSLATQVQKELKIHGSSASDVSAGCSGFIYSVEDAYNKIVVEKMQYGRDLKALVLGVDALSLVTDWTDRATCVLLADGAGAVVMGETGDNEILATYTEAEGKYGDLLYLDEFLESQLVSEDRIIFSNERHIHRPYLRMEGKRVFPVAVRTMSGNVNKVIERYNESPGRQPISLTDIEYVFPHQANLRIITSIAEYMGLPMENVYTAGIKKYGNNSAASIPIGYVDTKGQVNGKLVIDVAFGAGFASGAILRRA